MRIVPGILLAFFVILSSGRAEDVLHLKNGRVVRCEIVAITDNVLTYKTTIDIGGGRTASAQPTIPSSRAASAPAIAQTAASTRPRGASARGPGWTSSSCTPGWWAGESERARANARGAGYHPTPWSAPCTPAASTP